MLEKGTYISNEVLNEGIIDNIGYKLGLKKKSRWQRFKDTIKNNKGKVAAIGALGLGLSAAGALRNVEEPVQTTEITRRQSKWNPEEQNRIKRRINHQRFWRGYLRAMRYY